MQWIKIPLVVVALLLLVVLFRNRQRVELRAGTRLAAIGLVALAVASIIYPDLTQDAAQFLGVTRGTDLLLYILVVVFVFTTLGLYFRLRETDQRLLRLARALAIDVAVREGEPGSPRPSGPAQDGDELVVGEPPAGESGEREGVGPLEDQP